MFQASRLAFDPLVPWLALWGLGAVAVALWIFYCVCRGRAWLTRALAMTVVMLALLNPLWVNEQREPLKDIVAVVLDRSESMTFRGRTNTAQAAFNKLKAEIEADDSLELRVAETDPDADQSDVYSALQSALSDAPRERLGGAILITDGQVHDLPADPKPAAQLGPIHSLIVGGKNEIDRRIEIVQAPSFGIIDKDVEMQIKVTGQEPPGRRGQPETVLPVTLSINGDAQPVQNVTIGELTTIKFRLKRRGENLVVLQVPGIEGELTLANNIASAQISGVQDRLRVLLVTGQPYAGERVWRDLLKSDPSVDLIHFTILRPPSKPQAASDDELALIEFPKRTLFRDRLKEFDLVIFDHELSAQVLEDVFLESVARYVEQGGALLIAAGPPYEGSTPLYNTPLTGVLPGRETGEVVDKEFVPQLTELGKRHSVTQNLPTDPAWGPWRRYMKLSEGNAEALMKAPDGAPVLLLKRVEEGRVASIMSDQIWLWARGYKGGGPYAELIRRTAHWLMKEPELEEEYLELDSTPQEMKAHLRTLSDSPPEFALNGPNGKSVKASWNKNKPGDYSVVTPVDRGTNDPNSKEDRSYGLYVATSGKLKAVAVRGPAHPREFADLRATEEVTKPLADATGGRVYSIGDSGTPNVPAMRRVGDRGPAGGNDWLGFRKRGAYAVRATESTVLLPGVVGMLLAVGIMMFAWRREGR
jgi:hypothetical protein